MGNADFSVTDTEGKKWMNQVCGRLDAHFLEKPNPGKNKFYVKALKQILDQVDPSDLEVDINAR